MPGSRGHHRIAMWIETPGRHHGAGPARYLTPFGRNHRMAESGSSLSRQPPSCTRRWWKPQSRTRSSSSVPTTSGPPRDVMGVGEPPPAAPGEAALARPGQRLQGLGSSHPALRLPGGDAVADRDPVCEALGAIGSPGLTTVVDLTQQGEQLTWALPTLGWSSSAWVRSESSLSTGEPATGEP